MYNTLQENVQYVQYFFYENVRYCMVFLVGVYGRVYSICVKFRQFCPKRLDSFTKYFSVYEPEKISLLTLLGADISQWGLKGAPPPCALSLAKGPGP